MLKTRTHFEEVPLEKVKMIAQIQKESHSMSDPGLKYPEWQEPLRELLLESDPEKLHQGIQRVEGLISDRLRELSPKNDGHGEMQAISDALNILRIVKRDKLGLPRWR